MQQPAEKQQADDHFGSESLWIPAGGGGQRGGRRGEEGGKEEKKNPKPGPTLMLMRYLGHSKGSHKRKGF